LCASDRIKNMCYCVAAQLN